jgi:hypothetical protein
LLPLIEKCPQALDGWQVTFINRWSTKAQKGDLRNELQELRIIEHVNVIAVFVVGVHVDQADQCLNLVLVDEGWVSVVVLQNIRDLSNVDLGCFAEHVIKVFLTFCAICLVCIPLEHELPDFTILFHELVQDFSVSVFFFIQVNKLNLLLFGVLRSLCGWILLEY